MAENSFQNIQSGAIALIDSVEQKVKELDAEIIKLNANVTKLFSGGGANSPNAINERIKALETTVKQLNTALNQQTQNTTQLSQARQNLSQRTSEEVVNQRALAKAADTEAKSQSKLVGAYENLKAKRDQAKKTLQDLIASRELNSASSDKEIAKLKSLEKQYNKNLNLIRKFNKYDKKTSVKSIISEDFNFIRAGFKDIDQLREKNKRLREEILKLNSSIQKNGGSHRATTAEIKKAQKEFDKYNDKVNKANKAVSNFSKTSLGGMVRGFKNLFSAFGVIGGVYMFADLAKRTFNLTKTMQGLNYALKTVTKSEADLARTKLFISEISKKYGLELETTTERYTKFLVAAQQSGVSLADTEKIYNATSKAAGTLGLKTHELEGVYLALEQMLSKGKVTTEELRRQLGERLPGAFGIMAKAIGVSVGELDKMLKAGDVLSADALPKFADALEEAYGIESVEKIDTIQAAQNRLTNTWVEFIDKFSNDGGIISDFFIGLIGLATNALEIVLNFFDSVLSSAQEVSDSIKEAFKSDATREQEEAQKRLQDELAKTQAAYDALTDPIQKLSIAIKNLEINERNLKVVSDAYEGILSKISSLERKRDKLIVADGISKETEAINKQILALKKSLPSYEREVKLYEEKIKLIQDVIDAIADEAAAMESRREYEDVLNDIAEAQKRLQKSTKEEAGAILDQIDLLNKEKEAWERTHKAKKQAKEEPYQDPSSIKSMEETISKLKDMQSRVDPLSNAYVILGDQIKLLETILKAFNDEQDKTNDKITKQNDLLLKNIQKWSDEQNAINEAILEFKDQFEEAFATDFLSDVGFDFLSQVFSQFDELKKLIDSGLVTWEDYFLGISEIAQETFNFINKNQEAYFDNQLDRLAEEKEWSIQFAGESTAAREEIERQYEEKRKEILRRKAEAEKQTAIFNAVIDTAQAVVSTLATAPWPTNLVMAALVGAIGAAQIAMISSTPIPEYFRGTQHHHGEGWALVDEKNPEVHTDHKGNIKSWGQEKPNYRWMAHGDKVYTSHEEYFRKELKGMLGDNNIEYSSMIDMMPSIVIEKGVDNKDIVRQLQSMENVIASNEKVNINIDKNGFYTGITKQGHRIERMNNIVRLKRKGV